MIQNLKLLALALVIGLGASAAYAWTGPLALPPGCTSGSPGCDAPIHVGATPQSRAGALMVGSATLIPPTAGVSLEASDVLAAPGLAIYNTGTLLTNYIGGILSVATTSPSTGTMKLKVDGGVGASAYCDQYGNNCSTPVDIADVIASGGGSSGGDITGSSCTLLYNSLGTPPLQGNIGSKPGNTFVNIPSACLPGGVDFDPTTYPSPNSYDIDDYTSGVCYLRQYVFTDYDLKANDGLYALNNIKLTIFKDGISTDERNRYIIELNRFVYPAYGNINAMPSTSQLASSDNDHVPYFAIGYIDHNADIAIAPKESDINGGELTFRMYDVGAKLQFLFNDNSGDNSGYGQMVYICDKP